MVTEYSETEPTLDEMKEGRVPKTITVLSVQDGGISDRKTLTYTTLWEVNKDKEFIFVGGIYDDGLREQRFLPDKTPKKHKELLREAGRILTGQGRFGGIRLYGARHLDKKGEEIIVARGVEDEGAVHRQPFATKEDAELWGSLSSLYPAEPDVVVAESDSMSPRKARDHLRQYEDYEQDTPTSLIEKARANSEKQKWRLSQLLSDVSRGDAARDMLRKVKIPKKHAERIWKDYLLQEAHVPEY